MEAAGVAAAGSRSDAAQEVTGVRLRTALAASAVIHGVAILLAVRLGSAPLPPALVAFSVSLIAGTGGDGFAGEGAAYGTNPLPPYPIVARRLGMEGVVLLDVLVAPDGHAADVRVARSSGHPALDESALTTVREHWRFVPARRDGVPVESRVTVPIRFRLAV